MNAATEFSSAYATAFGRLRQGAGQAAPWLRQLREQAFAYFMETGFPTTRQEDWKYTSVTAVEKAVFKAAEAVPLSAGAAAPFVFSGLACHLLVFVNGCLAPQLSWLQPVPAGVVVTGLGAILEKDPAAVEAHLAQYADFREHGFAALNTALAEDGAYLYLPPGTVLELPVHLLFVTVPGADAVMVHPRNLIIAGERSQATVIEHYVSVGEAGYLTNAVTEIVAGSHSALEHVKLQEESRQAFHIATIQARQERGSRFTSHSISIGALLARNDINSVLAAEGAESHLNGLYLADGRQHVDHHTRIDHAKPQGISREYYKGILDGRARGVFNGKVIVHPQAQKSDAQQANKNLLLSADAEVDTKPELEIYADDVKCSHGATVGQLDENMIFYLRSRGLDEATAKSLLTYAFAGEMLERISSAPLRRALEARLRARLPEGDRIKDFYHGQDE